jgi:WD40 repeat protein
MLYLGDGKLMNCYNNGAVAIWNLNGPLSNTLTPLSYKKVHSSFTYKLRRMDPETVLTCSNDRYAKLFDIETSSILGSFLHEDSIWCSYPLN